MSKQISDKYTVSPIHLFFLMYTCLVGAGLMNFQRNVISGAGSDAWLSVIAAILFITVLIWMMFRILSRQSLEGANLTSINRRYFGRFLGTGLNLGFILYFVLGAFVTFRSYLLVIQVWIFPVMSIWPISLLILGLVYYTVSGGFQTVVGICFWGTILIFVFLLPQTFMVAPYLHPRNLLPLLNHSPTEMLQSTRQMSHQFLGCGVLLVIYPYIQNGERSRKWAYSAAAIAASVYLLMLLTAIMYFSPKQVQDMIWPTLSIISMIELPFMQRMEYFVLTLWLLKMLANIALGIWVSCHSLKVGLRLKPRISLACILLLFIPLLYMIREPQDIRMISGLYASMGEYLVFLYIPVLFFISLIANSRGKSSSTA